jgi:hypothetical protein
MVQIDKNLVCEMYKNGNSMRKIALTFNTNHKLISRILKGENIKTRQPLNLRGKRKFNCDNELRYNNMATHLRFDVDIVFLMQFQDFQKLKLLNDVITGRSGRFDVNTEWYKEYLLKFYYDSDFNIIYNKWIKSNFEKYRKPSLDHINPKSKKGNNDLSNLQFLTWFENRSKNDMSQLEWDELKNNITDYFI